MKAVVVYESLWGNTKEIAEAIGEGLGPGIPVLATDEATEDVLAGVDLIVAGAPIHGFSLPREQGRDTLPDDKKAPRPADVDHPTMRAWLKTIPTGTGRAAAFETRFKWSPGSATRPILNGLKSAGYQPTGEPGRFVLGGSYGPMKEGEIERAKRWGADLAR